EPDIGQGGDDVPRRRELARPDEELVHESGLADGPAPALDVVATEPVGIGLVVDLVPDPEQAIAAGAGPELRDRFAGRRVAEVAPADDAADERRVRRGCEEFLRLLDAGPGLDDDRRVDPRGVDQRR